jgi:hypothetical protein
LEDYEKSVFTHVHWHKDTELYLKSKQYLEKKSKRHFTEIDGNAFHSHFTKMRNLPGMKFDPEYGRCSGLVLKWPNIFLHSLFYDNPVWELDVQRFYVMTDKKLYSNQAQSDK